MAIPSSVKSGIGLLFGAWVWLLYSVYYYYDRSFTFRFLIGGIVLFICLLQFKSWARILVLLSNAMTILYCAVFAVAFHVSRSDPQVVVVSVVNVLLFSLSSYFFLHRTSAAFFKGRDSLKSDQS